MMWSANTNYKIAGEWELDSDTIHVMNVFAKIDKWAVQCKSKDNNDTHVYYKLYRAKILTEIPCLKNLTNISRCIKELEDKQIIASINKNTEPAYRLTAKGILWKKKYNSSENSNGGETAKEKQKLEPKPKKEKKAHKFSITPCLIDECEDEYLASLQKEAYAKCDREGIPRDEYGSFIRYWMQSTKKKRNWLAAFGSWCANWKKYNKPKESEFVKGGLYY